MFHATLVAALALLLTQGSDGKDLSPSIKERSDILKEREIERKGDEESTSELDLKGRVRRHGVIKTAGGIFYEVLITPFRWMLDVVTLPIKFIKTIKYAWDIRKENKADAASASS